MNTLETQIGIRRLTGLSEEQYAKAVWHGAYEYAKWFGRDNEILIEGLLLTRSFWRWWTAEWHKTDMVFLAEYGHYVALQEYDFMLKAYWEAHRPAVVASYPDGDMVNEAQRLMNGRRHG
jgi:hypothetical protein